jgi:hypothetical protein
VLKLDAPLFVARPSDGHPRFSPLLPLHGIRGLRHCSGHFRAAALHRAIFFQQSHTLMAASF